MVRVRAPRRRGRGFRWFLLMCGILAALAGGYLGWLRFVPNTQHILPDYGVEHAIVLQGKVMKVGGIREKDEVKLPLTVVEAALGQDEPVRYEEKSGSIIMTTADKVVHLQTNALTATVNRKPFEMQFAAEKKDGEVYIPLTPLQELYGLQADYSEDTGIITLLQPGNSIQRAKAVHKGAAIRTQPTIRAPIAEQADSGSAVRIWGEQDGWYVVQGTQGYIGYAAKSDVILSDMEVVPEPKAEQPFIAWKVIGSKINLTWEAVYQTNPDPAKIGDLTGVNVVSPTWMELQDGTGKIRIKADPAYVNWAHKQKMQIWAVFGNGFEPERTSAALAAYETRFKMIQQLLAYAKMYKLQGINLDFENVYTKDKSNLVQFVRELTPLMHEQGLVVSIDVTPKSNSEMWSAFLDREALGKTVDFMMLMAYDEHWATSPEAGSVASLPWTEQTIAKILEEDKVSPGKLILGMPLYTRIWTEGKDENGASKVSSKAVGMVNIEGLIASKKLIPVLDQKTGQHYVEYKEDGVLNRIWLEDGLSIKARVDLAKKYKLAGVATWQRTFQKPAIWKTIDDALRHYP